MNHVWETFLWKNSHFPKVLFFHTDLQKLSVRKYTRLLNFEALDDDRSLRSGQALINAEANLQNNYKAGLAQINEAEQLVRSGKPIPDEFSPPNIPQNKNKDTR